MEGKAFGTITAEVKALETSDPNGAFEAVLSTSQIDRDGEIVDAGAFLPLPKSIPIHVNHQFMDVAKVVGRGEPYYDGDVLRVKGVFASTSDAQTVRALVSEGMVQTMSVGFHRPTRDTKDGIPHVVSASLIEASFVSVPANTDALVTMAKTLNAEVAVKVGARNSGNDAERLQSIHDLAVANGAACETKAVESAEGKTPTITEPETAAASAPAAPHDVNRGHLARVAALAAEAELLLLPS